MASRRRAGDPAARQLRWLARGVGTLAVVFWSLALLASAIGEAVGGGLQWSLEGALLATL